MIDQAKSPTSDSNYMNYSIFFAFYVLSIAISYLVHKYESRFEECSKTEYDIYSKPKESCCSTIKLKLCQKEICSEIPSSSHKGRMDCSSCPICLVDFGRWEK